MIPLAIGLITFFITKKVKKFDTFKAFKYASLGFFIPAGIIFVLGLFYIGAGGGRTAGVAMPDPIYQQCMETCRNTTQEITNATRDCINNCLENLRNK
jgi:protein tyrosine phosphatase